MKKLWKYVVGFFTFIGGILALFLLGSNKNKKVKEIKKKIDDSKKVVSKTKKENDAMDKAQKGQSKPSDVARGPNITPSSNYNFKK